MPVFKRRTYRSRLTSGLTPFLTPFLDPIPPFRAGLITQQVTGWLNLVSLPALAVCLANLIGQRKSKCP